MLTGPHPLFPLYDFHRAAKATLSLPSRGDGVTSPQNLQHVAHFPPLLLQVVPIGSLGFITSSEERLESPVIPVSAAWPNNEIQHKTPNTASGNEAAGERSNSLKGQRVLMPQILDISATAQSHELARVQGIWEPSSQVCSGGVI